MFNSLYVESERFIVCPQKLIQKNLSVFLLECELQTKKVDTALLFLIAFFIMNKPCWEHRKSVVNN